MLANFRSFFSAWTKVNKIKAIFDCFSKSFLQYFSEIFQTFTEFNEKLHDFTIVKEILQN